MKYIGSVAKVVMHSPTGPGFESQVPPYYFAIFLQVFWRFSAIMAYHTPSSNACQMASRPNLMAQMERAPCSLVNMSHGSPKVKRGLPANGPWTCYFHPWSGPKPPLLVISFSFHFIYLFILYYYFYYH